MPKAGIEPARCCARQISNPTLIPGSARVSRRFFPHPPMIRALLAREAMECALGKGITPVSRGEVRESRRNERARGRAAPHRPGRRIKAAGEPRRRTARVRSEERRPIRRKARHPWERSVLLSLQRRVRECFACLREPPQGTRAKVVLAICATSYTHSHVDYASCASGPAGLATLDGVAERTAGGPRCRLHRRHGAPRVNVFAEMRVEKDAEARSCFHDHNPLVPEAGIEPARCCHRQILSLLRLPISPLRPGEKRQPEIMAQYPA